MPGGLQDIFVSNILRRLEWCINNDRYTISNRKEYMQLMEDYGLTFNDQLEMLRNLTIGDFVRHDEDRKHPEYDVWIFSPFYQGSRMYVKFEVIDKDGDYTVVISAHPECPDHN